MKQATGVALVVAILAGTGAGAQAATMTGGLNTASGSGHVWTYDAVRYDLSAVPNVVFTQGGAMVSDPTPPQSAALVQFGAQSVYDDELVGFWSAGPTAAPLVAVPEAGTLAMLGLGLIGAGVSARRRRS